MNDYILDKEKFFALIAVLGQQPAGAAIKTESGVITCGSLHTNLVGMIKEEHKVKPEEASK